MFELYGILEAKDESLGVVWEPFRSYGGTFGSCMGALQELSKGSLWELYGSLIEAKEESLWDLYGSYGGIFEGGLGKLYGS